MASGTRSQATSGDAPVQHGRPVSILFVCLGNICRSTMAEGILKHLTHYETAKQHPLISRIDSCGTAGYHTGSQPDSRTLSVLAQRGGIKDYKHKARKIRVPSDFEEFDYVLGMDEDNMIDLRDMVKRANKKGLMSDDEAAGIQLYGRYGGKSADEEVQDPYYGGPDGFTIAYEQLERFGQGLLKHIEEQASKDR